MIRIIKITGTSCLCVFHLADGAKIEASSEFFADAAGNYSGQYVYIGSLHYAGTGQKLTKIEAEELQQEYERYAEVAKVNFSLRFVKQGEGNNFCC